MLERCCWSIAFSVRRSFGLATVAPADASEDIGADCRWRPGTEALRATCFLKKYMSVERGWCVAAAPAPGRHGHALSTWLLAGQRDGTPRLAAPACNTAQPVMLCLRIGTYRARLLSGFGVVTDLSRNQACDEDAEQSLAASARVVHELEKAEVKRQLVLRDA